MSVLSDLIEELPVTPAAHLLEFAKRVQSRVIDGPDEYGTKADFRAIYMYLRNFSERFDLHIHFPLPELGEEAFVTMRAGVQAVVEKLEDGVAEREVEDLLSQFEAKNAPETFGLAKLNSSEKSKIHAHIENVRVVIEKSLLPDRKKNALFTRLHALAQEVDAHGTKTDRFFAFAGDLAFVAGDMATNAKPMFKEVRAILKIVSRARAREEGISLPPGDEPLQLPQNSEASNES